MTLFIAVGMGEATILSVDRRISGHPRIRSEDADKMLTLSTPDSSVVIGIAGLAFCEDFDTLGWLRTTILEVGREVHTLDEITTALRIRLNSAIQPLPCTDRALSVVIAGFKYFADNTYKPGLRILTNHLDEDFQDVPTRLEFAEYTRVTREWAPFVCVGGRVTHELEAQLQQLADHADRAKDIGSVIKHSREIIQTYASSPASGTVVGPVVVTAVLPHQPSEPATILYDDPDLASNQILARFPTGILVRPGESPRLLPAVQFEMNLDGPGQQRPRSGRARCVCGSGRQYRRCHGRREVGLGQVIKNLNNQRTQSPE